MQLNHGGKRKLSAGGGSRPAFASFHMETIQEDVVKEEFGTDFKRKRRVAMKVSPVKMREEIIIEEADE